jgi:translocation and assembly module TamA
MHRFPASRLIAAALTMVFGLGPTSLHAADPQPYDVVLKPTGDEILDDALRDSATLISLRDKAPAGGFALIQRARDDQSRFDEALHAFGFYKPVVRVTFNSVPIDDPTLNGVIDQAPGSPPMQIVVEIDPGPRFHLGPITIDGIVPPETKISLDLKQGQDALAARVVAARLQLLNEVREAGYPLAVVILPPSVLYLDQNRLDVSFHVESGPRAALGQIDFSGLRHLSEAYMRRRLTLHPGEPYSPTKITAAENDLASLPAIASASIVPADHLDTAGNLPLEVEIIERPLHAMSVGAAYSTDLGASLNASWTHRDLFGQAEQLTLNGSVQLGGNAITKPGYQVGAQFIKPDFLTRDQALNISLSAVDQSLQAYNQTGFIERIGIDRKLSPHWSVQAGVLAEQERIVQVNLTHDYYFVGLPGSVKYDTTNNVQDATKGFRVTFSLTPVESFGKPGGIYLITQLSGSAYFDIAGTGRSVFAVRGLVGQVAGMGVFGLPPDQRLYAGGSGTVRGYRFQTVGPAFPTSATTPTGGTAVSAASVEFRQRILDHWGVAAFVDAGQVSTNGRPFDSTLHAGAGIGARYYTSIGPIRLDVAVPLNRQPGGDSFELYLGLGQAF